MNITIKFNGFTCWHTELIEYLDSINWVGISIGEVLYYSSSSEHALYNFQITGVTDGAVEMIAISE